MTVPVVDALTGFPLAGLVLDCTPPLLHAAASSAEVSGTPSFTGIGIRARNELLIMLPPVSHGK